MNMPNNFKTLCRIYIILEFHVKLFQNNRKFKGTINMSKILSFILLFLISYFFNRKILLRKLIKTFFYTNSKETEVKH